MHSMLPSPFWSGINLLIALTCVSIQLGIVVYCYRNRDQRGMRLYLPVIVIDALLVLVSTIKFVTVDEGLILLGARLQFVAAVNVPFWLIFTLEFVGVGHWLTRPRRILLFATFILCAFLSLTNDAHGLMFTHLELQNNGYYMFVRVFPNIGYVVFAICMVAVFSGGLALVSVPRWHTQPLYRSQRVAWFVSTAIIVIGLLLLNIRLSPLPQINILPIAYLTGSLIMVYAVFRRRFFTVMPATYNTVFDSLPVALFTLDANERLISMNAAAKTQFGLSDSLVGKVWRQVVEGGLSQHSGLRAGAEGEYTVGTQTFSVEHAALGQGRQARGRTVIVRDVTLFHRLRELEAFKTDMIRIAAHDLKNPLSIILNYSELMPESESEEERTHMISAVDRAAKRMKHIIDDFLSLERVEQLATELPTMPVCLNTLLGQLETDYAGQAAEKGVALQIVSPPTTILNIAGDMAQLYEAMSNLVGNAIKYTPMGGNVRVLLTQTGGIAQFEVVDTGVGIPQAQQARLFQPFYRALRDDIQDISGSGLGLYLVKSIITRHGGQMIFQSAAGQGSTFGFTLPLVSNEAASLATNTFPEATLRAIHPYTLSERHAITTPQQA